MKRWWWLLILFPLAVGLARLRFDVEVLNLLPSDLPVVEGLKLYQRYFSSGDELIVTVQASDADTSESAARVLALGLRRQTNLVSRALWQPPWIEHPDQTAELIALSWLNQKPEDFSQLKERLAPRNVRTVLESARNSLATSLSPDEIARLGYDPLGLSDLPESGRTSAAGFGRGEEFFMSADGRFRLIFLKPAHALSSYRDNAWWLEQIESAVNRIRHTENLPDTVSIGYTGAPAFIAQTAVGMQRDLTASAAGTLIIIAALFWWAHRRLLPLLWLVVLLAMVLAGTMAMGGLVFGRLNVVSLGFAAILLGLAVDYALVLYQESLVHPEAGAMDIRNNVQRGIVWSALTTAGAYLLLNFAGLPGLAQLGTLVALGVLLAAGVMLFGFLPLVLRKRLQVDALPARYKQEETGARWPWLMTWILLIGGILILWFRFPSIDHSADALSPTDIPAYRAMQQIEIQMDSMSDPLWLLVSGSDEAQVARRMETLENLVQSPKSRPWVTNVVFPMALWPNVARQQTNLITAAHLIAHRDSLHDAFREAGFTDEAWHLANGVLATWERAEVSRGAVWPTNEANRWLLEKVAARTQSGWLALGTVEPATNAASAYAGEMAAFSDQFASNGAFLTGWAALGEGLLEHTEWRLPGLVCAMLGLLALCLWLAFGSAREMLMSFATLALSFICLLALMSLFGWSWNLMNLVAAPLMLGVGVDYTIHTQLALRRHKGNASTFRRTTGRALLLCAGTTMAGFGSLMFAGNAGLASLGRICATGIGCVLLVSLFLLPAWRRTFHLSSTSVPSTPSSFYRAEVWRFGLVAGRLLPRPLVDFLGRIVARLYCHFQPRRREVVVRNLLPALDGNRLATAHATKELFQNFAMKIGDLWRFESGFAVDQWLTAWSGWEYFSAAHARGNGVLLVTPHLGNWEFGAVFMRKRGIRLLVLTQSEPQQSLTDLRQQSRADWGIQTVVVGANPFAFVEIIKQLQAGAVVALLMDRPLAATAVSVDLFGQPFSASNAAADLARASGAAILPVYVLREGRGYTGHILPEIVYERAAIGDRSSRTHLTQEILRAFEPIIRQHITQWYHFVPVWPQ